MNLRRDMIAIVTPRRYRRLRAALERRQPTLTVVMENVHKPHNVSAVIRTCDAVGVPEAHAVVRAGRLHPNRAVSKGAQRWVALHTYETVTEVVVPLQTRGFSVIAAHLSDAAVDFREIDYCQPTALLLGQEKYGVTKDALELVDQTIIIPMFGLVESLNVSVAAAGVLFEAQRQRLAAGMYEKSPLEEDDLERQLFEWAHPGAAAAFRERGEPYPKLDEDGQLVRE